MITTYSSPSEIISQNRITEHVFNRYDIDFNSVDKIKATILTEINSDFLVDILNVFCNYKKVKDTPFKKHSIPVLVDYLKKSHTYYLEKMLHEIGQSIAILLNNYHKTHPLLKILYTFYFNYKTDLQEHFSEEEEFLFPYANQLYRTVYFKSEIYFFRNLLQQFSVNDFIKNHSDTVKELIVMRNILLEYSPPLSNKTSYRVLIEQLKNFEKDLSIHAFIEDKILVSKLFQLEKNIKLQINN